MTPPPVHDPRERILIGWNEYVEMPEWGIRRLLAKVDTGARSSALHVENIRTLGARRVRFEVVLHRRKRDRRVTVEAVVRRRSRVRSSTGHYQTRIFVSTLVRIGTVEREIEMSLVDREKMTYRMLLGRSALGGDFLVDVSHRNLLGRPRRKRRSVRRRQPESNSGC